MALVILGEEIYECRDIVGEIYMNFNISRWTG